MVNLKKTLSMALAVGLIFSVSTTGIAAIQDNKVSGGWSESEGYYINTERGKQFFQNNIITTYGTPSDTPDSHTGIRLSRLVNGEGEYAAQGETVWYYKYHYTTARMELSDGTVKTTSGRVWDNNATKATSPYYCPGIFENTEARTYWGS